jgi:hypothetical protein
LLLSVFAKNKKEKNTTKDSIIAVMIKLTLNIQSRANETKAKQQIKKE